MAKFDANSITSIDYDLSAWGGPTGTVPEPSDTQIDELMTDLKTAMKKYDMEVDDKSDASSVTEKMNQAGDSFFRDMQDDLIKAYAKLCAGYPTEDELRNLPFRIRNKFFGYLMGEITSPES